MGPELTQNNTVHTGHVCCFCNFSRKVLPFFVQKRSQKLMVMKVDVCESGTWGDFLVEIFPFDFH